MTAFDPAAWLEGFAEAGGSYAVTSEGRLWLGIIGMPAFGAERHTVQLIGHPERSEAIKSLVRERCLIS
jgi:hypothetical protein